MQFTARRKHFRRSSDPESGHWSEEPQFSSNRLAESSLTPKECAGRFHADGARNRARIAHVEGLSRDALALK
jgi:hypothetical protein